MEDNKYPTKLRLCIGYLSTPWLVSAARTVHQRCVVCYIPGGVAVGARHIVISGFRHEGVQRYAVLRYYAADSNNYRRRVIASCPKWFSGNCWNLV